MEKHYTGSTFDFDENSEFLQIRKPKGSGYLIDGVYYDGYVTVTGTEADISTFRYARLRSVVNKLGEDCKYVEHMHDHKGTLAVSYMFPDSTTQALPDGLCERLHRIWETENECATEHFLEDVYICSILS